MKKLKAFTLVEVMIVLGIIGVVAAITIPTLNVKTEEARFIAQLHKANNTLQNAIKLAALDNDNLPVNHWASVSAATSNEEKKIAIKNTIKSKMNTINDCTNINTCLSSTDYKNLKKGITTYLSQYQNLQTYCFMTSDGITYCFLSSGTIFVDLNGPQKPNTFGVDSFNFSLNGLTNTVNAQNDLVVCNINNSGDDINKKNGLGCTAWALRKGNMDYRRKTVNW